MTKLLLLSSCLVALLLIAATPADGQISFMDGAHGAKWQFNCDFSGYDIGKVDASGENCGLECVKNPNCSHFSHHHGVCYLKKARRTLSPDVADGGICGFLVDRF